MKNWGFLLLFFPVLLVSCRWTGKRIKGNGHVTTDSRSVNTFTGVESHGNFDVYVSSGSPASVKVEAEDNLLSYIETYVENGVLIVRPRNDVWLRPRRGMKIWVTAPSYSRITTIGSGNIIGQNKITDPSKLEVRVKGNGDIRLDIDAPEVAATLTGNGGINLKGQSKVFDGELMGNGNIKAFDLMAEETRVHIMGNGDAEVFASVKLDVSIGGNGSVQYKGGAQASTHITGNGNIRKAD
jgi:hypothetical protein